MFTFSRSPTSFKNTVTLHTSAKVAPAAARHFLRFSCTWRACATASSPPTVRPSASVATQPETKTSRPVLTTWVKWLMGSDIPGTRISSRRPRSLISRSVRWGWTGDLDRSRRRDCGRSGRETQTIVGAGGALGEKQMTPVVNDGVMFTTTTALAFNRVHAVNAATGELLWKYERKVAEDVGALARVITHNRGVALYKDKVIFGTLDANLIALEAKTGKLAWETKIADHTEGYFVSQAPLVIKGKVVVGIAGPGEMGPRGFVEAFDAATGKSVWRWYSIPAAGEPGSETWQADTWKIGGGAVWHTGTYDPATNLLYVGTGNPAPWIADMRRGDNLYTMSAVALDVDSGKMKWYHQYLANEPWDFDTMAEHHVIDVVRGGQTHKAVVQANKLGYVYTLDRVTGKFLSAVPFAKSVTWGGPDPVTGKGVENPGLRPTMGGPPVEVCPSLLGATGWQPKDYNPKTGHLYIPSNEFCMRFAYVADLSYKQGQLFTGVTTEHFSKTEHAGVLRAFDVNQNKVLWEWNNRTPLISHTLTTAGDLVFRAPPKGKSFA